MASSDCPVLPRTRRVGDSDYSDGEEDFYYTEIKLNTDSMADGPSSLAPASPPTFPIPPEPGRTESPCAKTETKLMTPLSRSAPTTLYLVHTDHAYQVTCRDAECPPDPDPHPDL